MPSSAPAAREPHSADWFVNRQRAVQFDQRSFIAFAGRLRGEIARGREFGVCIASDAAVRGANRRFRRHDAVTDVLSFPDDGGLYLGDILISAPQARRQARQFGHSVDSELKILLLHGVLHLLGHDHERDNGAMRRLEQKWRRRFRLPTGLTARTDA